MKKINLFNKTISPLSDGKGCPVERGGVWELPPSPLSPTKFLKFCGTRFGATPSWKEGEHKVPSFRGTGPRKNVPSFRGNAESPRCCRELVCGKTDGIPLFSGMTKKICHKFPSREGQSRAVAFCRGGWRVAPAGVWFAALVALFVATPSFAEPTELDKKTVASKAYVDTKQDKIETEMVEFNDNPEYMLPAITTYDSTSGLVANKIGILDQETIVNDEGNLNMYGSDGDYGSEMDNFVPTVRAVVEGLAYKQDKLPAAWTNTTDSANMASTGGQTIDLKTTEGSVGRRYITAGGSQPLTQKTGADNVILYINGTKTLAQYQTSNFGGTGGAATTNQNYINGALVSLELLKDVYSALHNEIQNATPTGTPGNVAMYDPTTGALGDGRPAADAASYNETTGALENGGNIATIAAVDTRQKKKECGGYEPGHENEADYCWLWVLPD